jgi:hypothetical protein
VLDISVSCISDSCFEDTNSYVRGTFYQNGTNKILAPDSITVYGVTKESSLLYNKALNVKSILLPLDPSVDNCSFVFRINGIRDTVNLMYTSFPYLISKECGITFYYTLDSAVSKGIIIDTIIIGNKNITRINEENIRIFY